ncbi:SDR family NAD(P)-dependent oxidoreductase [Limnochorda pilosa]|uniref:Short-chain dehydrogenase n=1 Tax=Limnochorda pilosa TaxID=1555112 RepID=A0A0K2SI70_LIMPI|nr:SDR family NAD(P)-dependent oxidoreductase [Limnochorda pilosa]BAS26712.1 short-chain dehydrogenase [Limnochorda pilosa]
MDAEGDERFGLPAGTLAGQVAVVTGAARGIGRALALLLGRLGARVVIADLSPAGADVEASVRAEGGSAFFVPCDVADAEAVGRLAAETHRAFGPVDLLVNNAIHCPVVAVSEMDPATWDRVMAVNLRGTFLCARAFLPDLVERRGTMVNMVSADAMPHLSAYVASKQGIAGFSRSLAAEVGEQDVKVVALAPGMVDTPGLRVAARDLAPRIGMAPDELLAMAMPAPHAALAAVLLARGAASRYHGEQVDGYTVLEEAGYGHLARPSGPPAQPVHQDGPQAVRSDQPGVERGRKTAKGEGGAAPALLARRLHTALTATAQELERLPVFARTLARQGFKKQVGLGVKESVALAERLAEQMAASDSPPGNPDLHRWLTGLAGYFHGVPAQTARFTRDEAMLAEVGRTMAEREEIVRALQAAVERAGTRPM